MCFLFIDLWRGMVCGGLVIGGRLGMGGRLERGFARPGWGNSRMQEVLSILRFGITAGRTRLLIRFGCARSERSRLRLRRLFIKQNAKNF